MSVFKVKVHADAKKKIHAKATEDIFPAFAGFPLRALREMFSTPLL
jgi:hypothetical protein